MKIKQHSILVLLCFTVSVCYTARINAEDVKSIGTKLVNVKYDDGSYPCIAFIPSGEYVGEIAEVHESSKICASDLWFDIFDSYTKKRVVNRKYDNSATKPSIAFISSGTYAGCIAVAYDTGNLWFDIYNPYTQEKVVHFKYKDDASDPSIAFITSGKYENCIAEVHHENANGLWFNILKQNGEIVVHEQYDDGQGKSPSIAFISSGTYAGCIAEVHEFFEGQDYNLLFNILDQEGKRKVVNVKYEDNGLVPSIAFISSGDYAGYIVEAHQALDYNHLWLDVLNLDDETKKTGERIVNVKYDNGKLPSIVFIPSGSGEYENCIAETHLTSGCTNDLWFDIISTKK